jgi:hypothetical protein
MSVPWLVGSHVFQKYGMPEQLDKENITMIILFFTVYWWSSVLFYFILVYFQNPGSYLSKTSNDNEE